MAYAHLTSCWWGDLFLGTRPSHRVFSGVSSLFLGYLFTLGGLHFYQSSSIRYLICATLFCFWWWILILLYLRSDPLFRGVFLLVICNLYSYLFIGGGLFIWQSLFIYWWRFFCNPYIYCLIIMTKRKGIFHWVYPSLVELTMP